RAEYQRSGGICSMRTMRVVVAAVSAALILSASASAATYKVSAGAPANAALPGAFAAGLYDADAFYPGTQRPLRIHRGDRVTFSGGFHTATILGAVKRRDLELIQPDPPHTYPTVNDVNGTPFYWHGMTKFVYNLATLGPAGGSTVNSRTALFSSGVLFAQPHGYTLRFDRPGTFRIVCLIHPGMHATVQVLPRRRV